MWIRSLPSSQERRWIKWALVGGLCLAGCGGRHAQPLPQTYPVRGKVTYKDGTPVQGGMVQFEPQAAPTVNTAGKIGSDGTYSLVTMRDGLRAEGAIAGPNRATVVLPPRGTVSQQGGQTIAPGPVPPVIFPTPYNVESKENTITLTVEKQ